MASATSISNVAPARTVRSLSGKSVGNRSKKTVGDYDPKVPADERDEKNNILSNQQIVEKILQIQKQAL